MSEEEKESIYKQCFQQSMNFKFAETHICSRIFESYPKTLLDTIPVDDLELEENANAEASAADETGP